MGIIKLSKNLPEAANILARVARLWKKERVFKFRRNEILKMYKSF
jgi:hypothetical protein